MTKNTQQYPMNEMVEGILGYNYCGPKKTKEGSLIKINGGKGFIALFAINPKGDDTAHYSKFLEFPISNELAKKLKDKGADLSKSGGFYKVKYTIIEKIQTKENGYNEVCGVFRKLVDLSLYDKDTKGWGGYLLHSAHQQEVKTPKEEVLTTAEPADVEVDDTLLNDDELPF